MPAHFFSWRFLLDLGWMAFLLIIFIYFWRIRIKMLAARTWFQTKGNIIEFEWVHKGHTLWPRVVYTYSVNDHEFVGEFLFLDVIHNVPINQYTRNVAYKVAHAFRYNHEISVYYNPTNPEQAVLDIKIPRKLNGIIVFISLLIVLHLIFMSYQLFFNV